MDKLTFQELYQAITDAENCAVSCEHFTCSDVHFTANKMKATVQSIIDQKESLKSNFQARRCKNHLEAIHKEIQENRTFPVGTINFKNK